MKTIVHHSVVVLLLAISSATGINRLSVVDGEFHTRGYACDLWGLEMPDEARFVADEDALRDAFQPWVDHGINTLGFSLQGPDPKQRFFTADGTAADPAAGNRFTQLTSVLQSYRFSTIVSLFSARREHWLDSPEAYRQAVRTSVKLLPSKHYAVFIVGDLFGFTPWSPDCPYPLNEPANVIELCRIIRQTNPEVLIGVPASIIKNAPSAGRSAPLFYVAATADALGRFLSKSNRENAQTIAVARTKNFLRRNGIRTDHKKATDPFLARVERERLAVRAPMRASGALVPDNLLTSDEKADGWVSLFDGRTLERWTTLRPTWATWSVKDGAIQCGAKHGPWLRTRKRYGSFELRLEYKIVKGGNSGVFIWAPLDGRSSRFGMEVQLHGHRKAKLDYDTTGSIYAVLPPREDPSYEAGQWNRFEIRCVGSKVIVTINDRIVQDFDADTVPKLKKRLRRGFIGVQDHGREVSFRNLRVRELPNP